MTSKRELLRWEWDHRNWYELLEIPRDASLEEIKEARKRQRTAWDPDRVIAAFRDDATVRAQAVEAAYTELSDTLKRKKYDATLMPEPAHDTAFANGAQQNSQVWKRMAAWMKDEDVGTSFQRRMAFQAGDYIERRRQPSEKQLKYMLEAWELALDAGFDPKHTPPDE